MGAVNRYERDRRARKTCLSHWGYHCMVCDISFQDRYGPLGQDFIHVHHTIELSLVPPDYHVDPIADLRPVCPNCHAMLHRTRPAMTIDALKKILRKLTAEPGHGCSSGCSSSSYAPVHSGREMPSNL